MAANAESNDASTPAAKKDRGPRPFPVASFADSLALARGVHSHAAGTSIRRVTLFDKLGNKPESGRSRQLIANSNKYGLTTGNAMSELITITDQAATYLDDETPSDEKLRIGFELAITRSDVFAKLYDRLKDKRVPAPDVLRDEVRQTGVPADQAEQAARVFIDNVRFLGLVRELSGVERLIPFEQALEETGKGSTARAPRIEPMRTIEEPLAQSPSPSTVVNSHTPDPSVHIDIQIHIDASASPEQIDQIFASMAKHLYRRGGTE